MSAEISSIEEKRAWARSIARPYLEAGEYQAAFEAIYKAAGDDPDAIPWAELLPNPNLVSWLDSQAGPAPGSRALVVGCGLGDDAEHLAERGYEVTAFDLSETAVSWARRRFPQSTVDYLVADIFDAPKRWHRTFDLIVEIYTLQTMPETRRAAAMGVIADWVAPGGRLLIITRARDPEEPLGEGPWPLSRPELDAPVRAGLILEGIDDFLDYRKNEDSPVRRFRASYRRDL